jgi:hypothetical protein
VTPGVKERPPVPGFRYAAFVVHPPSPGPVILAIAHREGRNGILDVIRESIEVGTSAELLKRYGIGRVVGAPDEGDGLAHAAPWSRR